MADRATRRGVDPGRRPLRRDGGLPHDALRVGAVYRLHSRRPQETLYTHYLIRITALDAERIDYASYGGTPGRAARHLNQTGGMRYRPGMVSWGQFDAYEEDEETWLLARLLGHWEP